MKLRSLIVALHAALFCLVLAVSPAVSGSMLLLGAGKTVVGGGGCTPSSQASTFLARTSALSVAETDATCLFINKLVIAGIITGTLSGARGCGTVAENIYFLATKDKTTAYLNICGTSFGLTETATVTCTVDVGCAGDGVSGRLDTGWAPSIDCANCTLSSISIASYIQTATAVSATVSMGTAAGGTGFLYIVPVQSGSFFWDSNGLTFPSFANANPQGAWVTSKTAANLSNVYLNAATTKASAVADNDVALPTTSMFLLALNNAGTPGNFSNYVVSCTGIFKGLTSTQAFAWNDACNTAMTTLGSPVY